MAERTNLEPQQRVQDESPERSAIAIRQDIAAKRESISETVDKLGERIHETLDWRGYVVEHPAVALGLAAGVGFLVAGVFKRKPSPQERILDALAGFREDMADRVSGASQKKSGPTVKAAITAMVSKAAVDFLKKQMGDALTNGNSRQHGRPTT